MITPVKYFWEQFNGPQVTAIVKAVFEWLKASFDRTLDYFNGWSVKTVNSKHLTTVGILMGIGRPILRRIRGTQFFFTNSTHGENQHNNVHGFSEVGGEVGGRFQEIDPLAGEIEVLQDNYYEALLEAVQKSEGEAGSLTLLDDIANALNNVNNTPLFVNYEFTYYRAPYGRPGDVRLFMGNITDWERWTYALAAIEAVTNTLYRPEPTVFTEAERA